MGKTVLIIVFFLLTKKGKDGIIMADNRIAYGLAKKYGIDTSGMSPKEVWEALKKKGVTEENISDEAYDSKENKALATAEKVKKYKKNNNKSVEKINKDNLIEHAPDKYYKHKDGYIAGAKKGIKMSFEQADNGACNPYYQKVEKYDKNCQTCVAVYIARRLGYDVRALPKWDNDTIVHLSHNNNIAYLDSDGWHPEPDFTDTKNPYNFLDKKIKKGKIFSVRVDWKEQDFGHVVVAERDKQNRLIIYDPQSNEIYRGENIKKFFSKTYGISEYTDLTNVSMDEKICDKIMKKR